MRIVFVAVLLLMTAIGCEVGATAALPRADSFHHPGWSLVVVAGYVASTWLLSVVIKTLPLGVTYATWAGVGTVAVVAIGWLSGEQMSVVKVLAVGAIVAGVVALNATGSQAEAVRRHGGGLRSHAGMRPSIPPPWRPISGPVDSQTRADGVSPMLDA